MELQVEATGETVGEAKWSALRELERQRPGLDKSAVRFQVVSEGDRGLLGVGFTPARVIASVSGDAAAAADPATAPSSTDDSELAAEARELVQRIVDGIGVSAQVGVEEREDAITVSCTGPDLGMLIGRHGQTIDAIQYLANAAMYRGHSDDRKEVVVDAAGYRDRRRASLEALAVRSAERALASLEAVELDPMTAVERKVVHVRLKEFDGVETTSEGTEPNRFVVIRPV
ncbi:MAG TPA: RNA-binding cell elongation regulator Jag/EloR [Gaiellaceae bacterium]